MKNTYKPIFNYEQAAPKKKEKEESWAEIFALYGGIFGVGFLSLLVIGG